MANLGSAWVNISPAGFSEFGVRAKAGIDAALKRVSGDVVISADTRKALLNVDALKLRVDEVTAKAAAITLKADDKQALATITKLDLKLGQLSRKVASPTITLEGKERALAGILEVDLALDKLNAKSAKPSAGAGAAAALKGAPLLLGGALAAIPAAATLTGAAGGLALGAALGAGALALAAAPVIIAAIGAVSAYTAASDNFDVAAARVHTAIATNAVDAASAASALTGLTGPQQQVEKLLGTSGTRWDALTKAQQNAAVSLSNNKSAVKALLPDQAKALTALIAQGTAYAQLTPAQQAFGKGLGTLQTAWANMQAAISPTLLKLAGSVMSTLAAGVKEVGATALIAAPGFSTFLTDSIKALVILLPEFNPLVKTAADFMGTAGKNFLAWAQSAKSHHEITDFLAWFKANGPVVGGFLKSLAGALASLVPGLTAGGADELKVLSTFLGWISKLPKGFAGPLAAAVGALLLLAKIPGGSKVISLAVNLVGKGAQLLLGLFGIGKAATVDVAAAGMQAAADTMLAASENMLTAAGIADVAGGVAGSGAAATGAAASRGLAGKAGKVVAVGAIAAVVSAGVLQALQGTPSGPVKGTGKPGNWADNPFGANPTGTAAQQGLSTWAGLGHIITHTFDDIRHDTARWSADTGHAIAATFDVVRHDFARWNADALHSVANTFDGIRHDFARWSADSEHAVATTFDNVRHDFARWDADALHALAATFDTSRHDVAHWGSDFASAVAGAFDVVRHDTARWTADTLHALASAFDTSRHDVARWGTDFGNAILGAWTWTTTHVWDPVHAFLTTTLPGWFDAGVKAVGKFWGNLQNVVNGPVHWIGQYVLNPLDAAINSVASFVGLKASLPVNLNLATGGQVPGSGTGDTVPAMLTPGEVVVPKGMVAAGAVDHLRGRLPGFATGGVVGGIPIPGGGVLSNIGNFFSSIFSGAGNVAKILVALATGNSVAAANAFDALIGKGAGGASGQFGTMLTDLPGTLIKDAVAHLIAPAKAFAGKAQQATGTFTPGAPASGSAAAAQAFARSILPAGWSWPDLQALWNQESGWNSYAVNPSSGAYGIPQALGHGHPYNLGDYANQIRWGISYIAGRYGNSQAAWAHELANNWYGLGGLVGTYDKGGVLPSGGWGRNTSRHAEIVTPATGAGSMAEVAQLLRATNAKLDTLTRVTATTGPTVSHALTGSMTRGSTRGRY